MKLASHSLRVRLSIYALGLVVVGVTGFLLGRHYLSPNDSRVGATASGPPSSALELQVVELPEPGEEVDTSRPGWALEFLEADEQLDRYNQVINGIPVGPTARHTSAAFCSPGEAAWIDIETAQSLDPEFVFDAPTLPQGGVLTSHKAVACSGTVVYVEATIEFPAGATAADDMAAGASWFDVEHGGQVVFYKDRFAAPGWKSTIAAERWSAAEVDELPAAIGHAVLNDEFGESAIVAWNSEESIQVVVRGFDVELSVLMSVAREALK
jgi:hypothetical protein